MQQQGIRVGWAGGDVTPSTPVTVCGQFHVRIATEVRDPVTATAMAIEAEHGGERAAVVSLDAVFVTDPVRALFDRKLAQRLPELPPQNVLISATHTHTAPTQPCHFVYQDAGQGVLSPEAYAEYLSTRLVDIVAEAWAARREARLAWGLGQAVVGYNRRVAYMDGASVMYGPTRDPLFSHIEGHEHHGLDLLFTFDAGGQLTGVVVNVSCPSQCTEGATMVSADFWHETRAELRRRFGPDLHVLGQCAAAGDQSPHLMLYRAAQERMFRLKGLLPAEGGDFNIAQRAEIASRIAEAVEEVLPLVTPDARSRLAFGHLRSVFDAPVRRLSPADLRTCRERIDVLRLRADAFKREGADPLSHDYSSTIGQLGYYRQALERQERLGRGEDCCLPIEIHALRVGDMAFVSNRFEYLLDFGDRIRARSPALQTFVVQLAGEGTYLAPDRSERGGGYGAWFASTVFGQEAGQMVVEESLRLLERLFDGSGA